uniref:Uncharacterized protein n=1 Tax=Pristionchus pacificus TaxID=54126 RepID=A0A2A6BFS9_PRIPA|eukprot:PDM64739.1 hypothetical protein PRIPAC_52995 [Pristionchus pacificus]
MQLTFTALLKKSKLNDDEYGEIGNQHGCTDQQIQHRVIKPIDDRSRILVIMGVRVGVHRYQ